MFRFCKKNKQINGKVKQTGKRKRNQKPEKLDEPERNEPEASRKAETRKNRIHSICIGPARSRESAKELYVC